MMTVIKGLKDENVSDDPEILQSGALGITCNGMPMCSIRFFMSSGYI